VNNKKVCVRNKRYLSLDDCIRDIPLFYNILENKKIGACIISSQVIIDIIENIISRIYLKKATVISTDLCIIENTPSKTDQKFIALIESENSSLASYRKGAPPTIAFEIGSSRNLIGEERLRQERKIGKAISDVIESYSCHVEKHTPLKKKKGFAKKKIASKEISMRQYDDDYEIPF